MCNAWNHRPGCTCGWGGDGHAGRRSDVNGIGFNPYVASGQSIRDSIYSESYINPNAHCPVCGAQVYFYQSPYGGRVYFDALGWPWPKHPCTDNAQQSRPLQWWDHQTLQKLVIQLNLRQGPPDDPSTAPTQPRPPAPPSAPPMPQSLAKEIDTQLIARLMAEGLQARYHGDLSQAAELFAEALKANYQDAEIWYALSQVLSDRAERVYCLIKTTRLAKGSGNIDIKTVEAALSQLKGIQPKHPKIVWPHNSEANRNSNPPVQQAPRKQDSTQAHSLQKKLDTWSLMVRTAKGTNPVRWLLITPGMRRQGTVPQNAQMNIALLQAIVDGLRGATQQPGAARAYLTVKCNYESVITQLQGKSKSDSKECKAILTEIQSVCATYGQVTFVTEPTNVIDSYFTT